MNATTSKKHCEKIKFKEDKKEGSHVNKIKDMNTKMKQIMLKRWCLKVKLILIFLLG